MVKAVDTPKKLKSVRKSIKKTKHTPFETTLSDMNDDCLASVFDHLDMVSLVRMTKTSQRLKEIVTKRVIPSKTVKFDELSQQLSTRKVFELFGPTMTRLDVNEKDIQITQPGLSRFGEVLRLIMAHGIPGQLKQLTISDFYEHGAQLSTQMLEAVRPYLENVQALTIKIRSHAYPSNASINKFMEYLPKQNLRHLHLTNVKTINGWLSLEALPKLEKLQLSICRSYFDHTTNMAIEQLRKYIGEKPQLISFDYAGINEETIQVDVSRHIPNITRIGTVRNLMVDQQVPYNNNNDNSNSSNAWNRQNYRSKWKHLAEFTNLKSFSLDSHAKDFKNCGEIFRILAARNTVEHLELSSGSVYQQGQNPVDVDDLRQMTNVTTIQLNEFGRLHSDVFVGQLLENLIGLQECTIKGSQPKQAPIIHLVKNGQNLRKLNMTTFTSKFYRKLVKIRRISHPDLVGQPLVIRVPKNIADNCISELSSRTYKPSIIIIQPTQQT